MKSFLPHSKGLHPREKGDFDLSSFRFAVKERIKEPKIEIATVQVNSRRGNDVFSKLENQKNSFNSSQSRLKPEFSLVSKKQGNSRLSDSIMKTFQSPRESPAKANLSSIISHEKSAKGDISVWRLGGLATQLDESLARNKIEQSGKKPFKYII